MLVRILKALRRCFSDEKGQAMTEYAWLTLIIMTAAFYLYHPGNGLYKALRERYDNTTTLLVLPGP